MSAPNLFAHLVGRFAAQPENLATEALAYVLSGSAVAAEAMGRFIAQTAGEVGPIADWATQYVTDAEGIPDLVGTDSVGDPVLVLEAKFWAGLTENQPASYLGLLPRGKRAALLVVAPEVRLDLLWPEVRARVPQELDVRDERRFGTGYRAATVDVDHTLAMCSWRGLLGYLAQALSAGGELSTGADLDQLAGLCEQMDTTEFLPLGTEELTGATGARIVQYAELVQAASSALIDSGVADVEGLSAGHGWVYWGRYMRLAGWICMLRFAAESWSQFRSTPIWLRVGYKGDPPTATAVQALRALPEQETHVFVDQGFVDVAIDLPTGVERAVVVDAIVNQVRQVAEAIGAGTEPTAR